MHFFCTKEHYDAWTKKRSLCPGDILCLDGAEALGLAKALFELPVAAREPGLPDPQE